MASEENKGSSKKANIHKARLHDLVQTLRETDAVIEVGNNETGRCLRYGDGDDVEFNIKDFWALCGRQHLDMQYQNISAVIMILRIGKLITAVCYRPIIKSLIALHCLFVTIAG